MKNEIKTEVNRIFSEHEASNPDSIAAALRELWLQFEPKSTVGIKAKKRKKQETIGIPVKALRAIGGEAGKRTRKQVNAFLPLMRLLWDSYGREGRVVAAVSLGKMELADPTRVLPVLVALLPRYEAWAADPDVSAKHRRSIESAIKHLKTARA